MYNSLIFQILTILHVTMCTMSQSLIQQIYNTQQLIALYQQKLEILVQMYESQNQNKSISQNRTVNQAKTSKHSTIFKLQQQIIFQSNIQLGANSQYVGPNYLINGTQIMDITQNTRRFRFVGHLIGFQPVQITTRISDDQIAIYKLGGEDLVENRFKLKVRNQVGKWHHATQFQDIFLQYQLDTLTLTSQKQTKIYKFKSEIIKLFSINQYKILFVTRYSYGYLNPKSFEVTSQTQFDSIAQSCYYSSIQATLLILFNDRNLMVIVHGNVVSKQSMPGDIIITKNTQMDYLGSNYLFVYENGFKCFNIFEISTPSYLLTHNRQICPLQKFLSQKQKQPESMFFKYKFFKNRDNYKFLLTDNITETKLYILNLKQKQLVSQRTFPWKITLIIFCIVAVVYFRSSKSNSNKKIDPDEKMRAYKKLRREKLVNSQVGNSRQSQAQNQDPQNQQQYIQSLNSELRRMKNAKQGKKTN